MIVSSAVDKRYSVVLENFAELIFTVSSAAREPCAQSNENTSINITFSEFFKFILFDLCSTTILPAAIEKQVIDILDYCKTNKGLD